MNLGELVALLIEKKVIDDPGDTKPPVLPEVPWVEALDKIDWLQLVRDIRTADLAYWPDLCAKAAAELYRLDFSASGSLNSLVSGIISKLNLEALSADDHAEVNWNKWLEALEIYLKREDAELGEHAGVTFPEFCEAVAFTLQNTHFGLETWVSPNQLTPRKPINMGRVKWFIAMLLWRIPEWYGEGLAAGEHGEKEIVRGGGGGWSQPG